MADLLSDIIDTGRDLTDDVLIDLGALSRDDDGTDDDHTFDPDTLVASTPDDSAPYWDGACLVTPETASNQAVAPGQSQRTGRWRVLLPYTAPLPQVGDFWTTTASADASLVDEELVVVELVQSSALVFRTFYVSAVVPS